MNAEKMKLPWRYQFIKDICQGGFGKVILAKDIVSTQYLALKVSKVSEAATLKAEFIKLHRFNHPGLPEVYDYHQDSQLAIMAMEYCAGNSLEAILNNRTIAEAEAIIVLKELAGILSYIHRKGVVHADLKPSNVIINGDAVKLLDLGLAVRSGSTISGTMTGTPAYASPEVLSGSGLITQASDIYSLGLLVYEMFFGELPGIEKRLNRNEPLVHTIYSKLPVQSADILVKMLRYDPIERFESATELVSFLQKNEGSHTPADTVRFDYKPNGNDLKKIFSVCNDNAECLIRLSGVAGNGKTAFMKEVHFLNRMVGVPSYFIDAKTCENENTSEYEIENGAVVLIDDAGSPEDVLNILSARKKYKIVCAIKEDGLKDLEDNFMTYKLAPGGALKYQSLLNGFFDGMSIYDMRNLSVWLEKTAGDSFGRAKELIRHHLMRGSITQRDGIWHVVWSKIINDENLPDKTLLEFESWWQGLKERDKRLAINIGLGKVLCHHEAIHGLQDLFVENAGRWTFKDDQMLRFIIGKWVEEDSEFLQGSIENTPQKSIDFFYREPYRLFLSNKENWKAWLKVTAGMQDRLRIEGDVYQSSFLAQEMLMSGKVPFEDSKRLAFEVTDIYSRFGDWTNALSTWNVLRSEMGDDWRFWARMFDMMISASLYEKAEQTIKENHETIQAIGHEGGVLVGAYEAYINGLKGAHEGGYKILSECRIKALNDSNIELAGICDILNIQFLYSKGDWSGVVKYIDELRHRGIEFSNSREHRKISFIYGIALWMTSDLEAAKKEFLANLEQGDIEIPDQRLAKIYYCLGAIFFSLKEWENAKAAYNTSIYHGLATNESQSLTNSRTGLANIAMMQGRFRLAYQIYFDLCRHGLASGVTDTLIGYLTTLGILENMLGQKDLSLAHINKALALNGELKRKYATTLILKAKAGIEIEQGKWVQAIDTFNLALDEYRKSSLPPDPEIYSDLALAEYMSGNKNKALTWIAMAQNAPNKDMVLTSQIKGVSGIIKMSDSKTLEEGCSVLIEAGKKLMENGERFYAASCWLRAGEEAVKHDDNRAIIELLPYLFKAETEFLEMGTPNYLERVRQALVDASRIYFGNKPGQMISSNLLDGIYKLAAIISSEGDQEVLAKSSLELAVEMSGAERGGLFLLDEKGRINLTAQIDLDVQTRNDALEFSASAVICTAGQEEAIISNDASIDEAFSSKLSVKRNVIRSLLCVPIHFREGAAGAIYLDSRVTAGLFGREQKDFVMALARIIGSVLESNMLINRLRIRQNEVDTTKEDVFSSIIGQSPAIRRMTDRIKAIAKADVNILLDGESGSGKEVVAQAIHKMSTRSKGKFLALDCGSLPETLLESELFGYVKGSFTGAARDKTGLFESADGGTVFLDEIASASQAVQSRLLRVLESGEIRRVGDAESRQVDVRVICATNRDLEIEINEGRFRPDLYYRLKVITIPIPPLRDRGNDILLLAEYFKNKYQKKFGKIGIRFSSEAKFQMMNYTWPGNVRELENTIQKAVLLTNSRTISSRELEIIQDMETATEKKYISQKHEIMEAIKIYNGNITMAAKATGVSRRHMYRLINKHKIKL
jgi:Nif-specific regulatory protein